MTVMVDVGGMFTGYITDMTRTYSIGSAPEAAYRAHQVSIEIHDAVRETVKPGTVCEDIYELGLRIAAKNDLSRYFMGIAQHAKFIGHGIGLEINELPVLAPRFREPLVENMVFALEPKFVLPNIGAVGIENSYLVTETGLETLTIMEENMVELGS
jgi:Xaa-Pro aminopeptidase